MPQQERQGGGQRRHHVHASLPRLAPAEALPTLPGSLDEEVLNQEQCWALQQANIGNFKKKSWKKKNEKLLTNRQEIV